MPLLLDWIIMCNYVFHCGRFSAGKRRLDFGIIFISKKVVFEHITVVGLIIHGSIAVLTIHIKHWEVKGRLIPSGTSSQENNFKQFILKLITRL